MFLFPGLVDTNRREQKAARHPLLIISPGGDAFFDARQA
jgi:hypothetical protein